MNDKERLYNKSKQITNLLETLCSVEIDEAKYKIIFDKIENDLWYANYWLEDILFNW